MRVKTSVPVSAAKFSCELTRLQHLQGYNAGIAAVAGGGVCVCPSSEPSLLPMLGRSSTVLQFQKEPHVNDDQVLHALHFDDAYEVRSVLADGPGGTTELVFLDGSGPFVRKKIPNELARRGVWSALAECHCRRLPHVVATYELPDRFVAVYDYVPGETLESVVEARGRLSSTDAVRTMVEVCEALGALHARHIVHRDIAPGNIVIAADGAHVIDLGIARTIADAPAKNTAKLGTWGFASPEQFGFAQTDARSDVYAAGRLLAFMLTGKRPDSDDFEEALQDAADVPKALKAVVAKACSFEPSGRFASADEMAHALVSCGVLDGSDEGDCEAEVEAAAEIEAAAGDASKEASPLPVATTGQSESAAAEGSPSKKPRRGLVAVACLVGVAVVVSVGMWALGAVTIGPGQSQSKAADSSDLTTSSRSGASENQDASSNANPSTSSSDSGSKKSSIGTVEGSEDMLSIVESAWSMSNGYVQFTYALRNDLTDDVIELPQVTVTGKAADGTILFTQDTALSIIGPGQMQYYTSIANSSQKPATVEFAPVVPSKYKIGKAESAGSFTVGNVSEKSKGGMTDVTGEVRVDEAPDISYSSDIMVTAVFRDALGLIVGGAQTSVSRPEEGKSIAFDIQPLYKVDYASVEVHAYAW